jgi:hypothetical protein
MLADLKHGGRGGRVKKGLLCFHGVFIRIESGPCAIIVLESLRSVGAWIEPVERIQSLTREMRHYGTGS